MVRDRADQILGILEKHTRQVRDQPTVRGMDDTNDENEPPKPKKGKKKKKGNPLEANIVKEDTPVQAWQYEMKGHAEQCVALYGHVWRSMAICDHAWLVWPYLTRHCPVWPYVAIHGHVWPLIAIYGHVAIYGHT